MQWTHAVEAYARALPFEHLLRRRSPDEAISRWRTEASAYAGLDGPCVGLLLDCSSDARNIADTLASWRLQTWSSVSLVCHDASSTTADQIAEWFPDAVHVDAAAAMPSHPGWLIPAIPGDVFHPSLAGIVATNARAGADCVAWDWLSAVRRDNRILLEVRHRGPWRDPVAELPYIRRMRAYALPAAAFRGATTSGRQEPRLSLALGATGVVHPEPLSIAFDRVDSTQDGCAALQRAWSTEFERTPRGPQPLRAADGVSVIMLFRDRPELTLAAIESVLEQRFSGALQIVLVDNQSTAATRTALQAKLDQLPSHVAVTWVSYDAAFNHSRQCNLGAKAAVHPVLLFFNNDAALLDSDAIDRLARFALLPGVATVGARVVGADGATRGGGFLARREPGAEFNSPVEEATGSIGEISRMTVGNTFACAAVSAAVFRALGGLDEVRFPVGYNDVDFCLRAAKAGWQHINLAEVRIRHAVGQSRPRTDEIAQKLHLRTEHTWLAERALQEWADEPVQLPEAALPTPTPTPDAPSVPRRGSR